MQRRLATLNLTAATAAPLAGFWRSTPVSAATLRASAKAHVYKGSTVSTNWGPLQTVITVKKGKFLK